MLLNFKYNFPFLQLVLQGLSDKCALVERPHKADIPGNIAFSSVMHGDDETIPTKQPDKRIFDLPCSFLFQSHYAKKITLISTHQLITIGITLLDSYFDKKGRPEMWAHPRP